MLYINQPTFAIIHLIYNFSTSLSLSHSLSVCVFFVYACNQIFGDIYIQIEKKAACAATKQIKQKINKKKRKMSNTE